MEASVVLVGVALLGLAGLWNLGGAFGNAIARDAAPGEAPSAAAPMVTSRQAGLEEAALRFAREAEAAAAALRKTIGPEATAELTAQGAAIARKEHSLGRTPVNDIKRVMSARDFLSFGDELWKTVGEEGGLTPAEAKYWLAEGPTLEEIRAAAKAAAAESAQPKSQAVLKRAARAPGEVAISYADLPQHLIGKFLNQVNQLDRFDSDGRWIRYDKAGLSDKQRARLQDLAATVRAEPAVPQDMQMGSGYVLGFFEFGKVDASLAKVFAVEANGGVFVNVGEQIAITEKRLLEVVHAFLDRVEPRRAEVPVPPTPPPGAIDKLAARPATEAQQAFLKGFHTTEEQGQVRAWRFSDADTLSGRRPILQSVSKDDLASVSTKKDRAPLLAQGEVATYLETQGFEEAARHLRRSGKSVRIEVVDFAEVDRAIAANKHPVRLGSTGALSDVAAGKLYLNLGNKEASWPAIVKDFVLRVVGDGR